MSATPECWRKSNRNEGLNFFSVSSPLQVFFFSPLRASYVFKGSYAHNDEYCDSLKLQISILLSLLYFVIII